MKVYLDDMRTPDIKEGWDVIVRDAENAMLLLDLGIVTEISLDHDLGGEVTGYDVARHIEEMVFNEDLYFEPPRIYVHSANPVGRDNIKQAIASIENSKS